MSSIKFKTRIGKLEYMTNMHYLEIPVSIVKKAGGIGKKRFTCTVNGKISFNGGMVALGEGCGYITINAQRMKSLGVKLGSEVTLELTIDESKYGIPMPEEFTELLKQDPEGRKRFEKLSPGKKRTLIYYVSNVKSSQLKIERALKFITNLKKLPPGKETFRGIFGMDE